MRHLSCCIALACIPMHAANADGDGPTRVPSQVEASYIRHTLAAIQAALPAAPSGWTATRQPDAEVPTQVPDKVAALRVQYSGEWVDTARREAAGRQAEQENRRAMQAQMGPGMKKRMEEQQTLFARLGDAAQRGDQAEMKRIQARLQELSRPASNASPERATEQGGCLKVQVTANASVFSVKNARAVTIPGAPAGLQFYRADDGGTVRDCPEGITYAVFGAWKPADKGGEYLYFRESMNRALPPTVVQNIYLSVRASEERARDVLARTRWSDLQGLIGR